MKKIILVLLIFIIGCAEKECKTNDDCLTKTCFTVQCKDNKCIYSPITNCCGNEICEVNEIYPECAADCPNCDDANECTKDSYDYHKQKCVSTIIPNIICCGNSVCETGETYSNCARDCPNCDDENECTKDSYDYHKQKCINEVIIPCCGNGICDEETAETYLTCSTDCPDCDDDDKITADSFNYETQECENMIDLKIFPEPFVVNGVYDSSNAFVFDCEVKKHAKGMDVIDEMFLRESTTSTTGIVSQIISCDVLAEPEKRYNYNLIFVGGPCCNTLVEDIFGIGCEDWVEFKEDESFIILTKNGEDKVALLVAGYTSDDTVATAKLLADYKNYDLTGTEFSIKGIK